jgi:hypothetical protein
MMTSKKKASHDPLPRSVLSLLHEPLLDPKDGHGARSARDVMILQKWKAAREGDDEALADLVKLVFKENLAELKAARGAYRHIVVGRRQMKMRSLVPVMSLLKMVTVETIEVPPQKEGYATVTRRKRIPFEDWFEVYALERDGLDQRVVEGVRQWIADGSVQRRSLVRDRHD